MKRTLSNVLGGAASAFARLAGKLAERHEDGPLVIEKQGYFFVGGKYFTTPRGIFMSGQMYVEYQIPVHRRHPYPIVMWHGNGQSGTNFTGTPDGRDGWSQYFLRQGYAVYVVDQPGRGRSAYNPEVYGPQTAQGVAAVEQKFTAAALSKSWPQAHLHTQWPGSGVAGDPVFDQFYASQLPSIASASQQQALNRDAGAALLDKIGAAILFTHSQSGAYGWLIADARPKLVKAIVAAEPSGPPVYDATLLKDGSMSKPWGLAGQPLTYAPPAACAREMSFVQQQQPDGPDLLACWLQQEPARELINLKHIPILILTTESSYHTGYDQCTSRYLTQAGVVNTFVRLADHGIRGTGHMMMLEKNSAQIAALIARWLDSGCAKSGVRW